MLRNKLKQSFGPTEFSSLVWRGATRHPSVIFDTGFEPKSTTNDCVMTHIKIKAPSAYVAVRRDFDNAFRFMPMNGFMYAMNLPEIFVDAHDMYKSMGKKDPHCANIGTFENELAAACHLIDSDIYKAKQWSHLEPGEGFYFAEPTYMNAKYKPRNWAFEILSRNTIEAESYEKELDQTGMLPENMRVMTLNEAQYAVEAFRHEFKDVIVPFNAPVTVIKTIPADLKNVDAVVDYAIKQHVERLKAQELPYRITSISLFTPKKIEQKKTETLADLSKQNLHHLSV